MKINNFIILNLTFIIILLPSNLISMEAEEKKSQKHYTKLQDFDKSDSLKSPRNHPKSPRAHTRLRSRSMSEIPNSKLTTETINETKNNDINFSEDDYKLYCNIQRIAKYIINYNAFLANKCFPEAPILLDFQDNSTVNPSRQTKSGVFLIFFEGLPIALWTPWGQWTFTSVNAKEPKHIEDKLIKYLNVCLTFEEYFSHSKKKNVGPIYKIIKMEDEDLPYPKKKKFKELTSITLARSIWQEMRSRYNEELNTDDIINKVQDKSKTIKPENQDLNNKDISDELLEVLEKQRAKVDAALKISSNESSGDEHSESNKS